MSHSGSGIGWIGFSGKSRVGCVGSCRENNFIIHCHWSIPGTSWSKYIIQNNFIGSLSLANLVVQLARFFSQTIGGWSIRDGARYISHVSA